MAPGPAAPRQLAGGEVHAYEIDLPQDFYVQAAFDQRGVDLAVDVYAPGRRRLFRIDSPNGSYGPEELHLVTEDGGRYRFEVSASPEAPPAEYLPELRGVRKPSAVDRSRAAADRALYEAKEIDGRAASFWEAVAKYETSIRLYQEVGDPWRQAYALFRLGRLQLRNYRSREALDAFIRAQQLFHRVRDDHLETVSLNEIGTCYRELADFAGASNAHLRALDLARRTGEEDEQARALHNLGLLYQLHGRPWQALSFFRQALDLWQRQAGTEARVNESDTLTGIGWVYTSTGDWQRAVNAHWRALRIRNRLRDLRLRSISLTQIGHVWLFTDPRRALPFLEKARALQKDVNSPRDEAATLTGLGLALRRLERYEEAQAAYRRALGLYAALSDPGGQAITWTNLGWTSLALNESKQAQRSFEQGLRLARQTHNPMAEARALLGLARAEHQRGNIVLAQTFAEQSLKLVESLRAAVVRPDLQISFLAANENAYSLLIEILMEHHRQQPGRGYDLQALHRSEQARARVLLDSLRQSRELRVDLQAEVAPALLERRRAILAEISAQDALRRRQDADPSQMAAEEHDLAELIDRLSETDAEIRRQRLGHQPPGLPPASVEEQRRRLLDPDTLLLEYYLENPRSYLWVISLDGVQSFELPGTEVLEPLLRSTYAWLAGAVPQADRPAGERQMLELSRLLLGPVASQMRGKRLLIAAAGTQQYIPFAALPEPGGRHEPLLLHHEIVYVPSLAVLAELRGRAADREPAPRTLAVVADPVFDASDERFSPDRTGEPVDWQDVFLPRLHQSRAEAEGIAALLPPGQVFKALGFEASRELVTSGQLSRYRNLHFATHGIQRTDHPQLSALVLSLFDAQGNPRDGYLRVPDLADVDLGADLVVLSACETALGRLMAGEGLVGLPQAFLAAGAQRVLVSLWQVEDESTAALMRHFYRRLLLDGMPPGSSLRDAQLAIRAQPRWRSPRYWAGFVLQGDWR